MKIVHVVDSMEVGGAEALVAQMCDLQRQRGDEPRVYAIAKLGALGERLRQQGIQVEANVGRHLIDSSAAFFKLFRAFRPDVVHLHNPTPTIYAAPAARLSGVPSIISTRHSLVAPPRDAVMERKYAFAARFCDWVVGICDATVKNVREAGSAPEAKLTRIYNGTNAVAAIPSEQQPEKKRFTLLFVGRLEPVKNLPLLLQAMELVVRQNSSVQLWLVGDGTQRAALEQLAAGLSLREHVKFWGQQLHVDPFFSAADAFVMTSISEGLPMSLLQAFSAGLPAIVTDVGGMAEVVRFAQAGLVLQHAEPAAISAAILRLHSDQIERERLSANASAAFHSTFQLGAMVESYSRLYRNTPRAARIGRR